MKKLLSLLSFIAVCAATIFNVPMVSADAAYPYQNSVYIPSAISPVATASAPTTYSVTLQNAGIIAFEINGTCTSLAATVQVSVDGTTWRAVNVYPVVTSTITAAASISAAGAYRANVAGARAARLNVTALTATCNFSAVATSGTPAPNL